MADQPLRVAIVHDWLIGGGAERVTYELHKMYPDAPIYTSYCSDEWREKMDGKIVTGFLQHWPFSVLRKVVMVLRIWWFTHLDFSGYDLVISVSGNGEAKGIRTPEGTTHVCYCHTPTHYYWRHYEEYLKRPGFGAFDPIVRLGLRLLVGPLRRWDLKASKRPDHYIANSTHIQADIKKYYGRDSIVIHPPIDIERFDVPEPKKRQGLIVAGRQKPYKYIDLVIEACNQLALPLKVVGEGPEHSRLVRMAGPTVTFVTGVSDAEMPKHFVESEGFVFAAFEDFGVMPVEALAAGTPLIAYKAGGALDYVEAGKSGIFFEEQTVESLTKALRSFRPEQFNHNEIRQHARAFSAQNFEKSVKKFIQSTLKK